MQLTLNVSTATALKIAVEPGKHIIDCPVATMSVEDRGLLSQYLSQIDQSYFSDYMSEMSLGAVLAECRRRLDSAEQAAREQAALKREETNKIAREQAALKIEVNAWVARGMPAGECPCNIRAGGVCVAHSDREQSNYFLEDSVQAESIAAEINRRETARKLEAETAQQLREVARLDWLRVNAPKTAQAIELGYDCDQGIAKALLAWGISRIAEIAPSLSVLDRHSECDSVAARDTPSDEAIDAQIALKTAGLNSEIMWGKWSEQTDDDGDVTQEKRGQELVRVAIVAPWGIVRDNLQLECTLNESSR
jgi:hypothetical protein